MRTLATKSFLCAAILVGSAAPAHASSGAAPAIEEAAAGGAVVQPQPRLPAMAPAKTTEAKAEQSAFDRIWAVPLLHRNDDADIFNELRLVGRLHLDNYILDSNVGDASDLVVRRARLGARARFFKKLEAHLEADVDLEGGPVYGRLTDAYLAWRFSDAARLMVGKQSVKFTLEGATSATELVTIDRSNVANNLWFTEEYIPGVSVSGRSGAWSYTTGLYSGGPRNREFGDFTGGSFWLASVGRDFADQFKAKRALLRADYVRNEPDPESSFTRPFQDVAALVFIVDTQNWGVSGDLVAGNGFLGQSDTFGATLLSWANLSKRLQLAGRYAYVKSEEPNGVRFARYENIVARGRGDRYHELYAGLNYLIYGNRLKAQTGLTYANMRDRARDGGAYDGWTWTTALRVSW